MAESRTVQAMIKTISADLADREQVIRNCFLNIFNEHHNTLLRIFPTKLNGLDRILFCRSEKEWTICMNNIQSSNVKNNVKTHSVPRTNAFLWMKYFELNHGQQRSATLDMFDENNIKNTLMRYHWREAIQCHDAWYCSCSVNWSMLVVQTSTN